MSCIIIFLDAYYFVIFSSLSFYCGRISLVKLYISKHVLQIFGWTVVSNHFHSVHCIIHFWLLCTTLFLNIRIYFPKFLNICPTKYNLVCTSFILCIYISLCVRCAIEMSFPLGQYEVVLLFEFNLQQIAGWHWSHTIPSCDYEFFDLNTICIEQSRNKIYFTEVFWLVSPDYGLYSHLMPLFILWIFPTVSHNNEIEIFEK